MKHHICESCMHAELKLLVYSIVLYVSSLLRDRRVLSYACTLVHRVKALLNVSRQCCLQGLLVYHVLHAELTLGSYMYTCVIILVFSFLFIPGLIYGSNRGSRTFSLSQQDRFSRLRPGVDRSGALAGRMSVMNGTLSDGLGKAKGDEPIVGSLDDSSEWDQVSY